MLICKNCKTELHRGQYSYCSAECQHENERAANTKRWLDTGIASISHLPNHYIRIYIRKQQDNKCEICKNSPIWNDKDLIFILDHIDGDSDNNSRKNLRLVCPNCDSQLSTFKGRNAGNGRHFRRERYKKGQSY